MANGRTLRLLFIALFGLGACGGASSTKPSAAPPPPALPATTTTTRPKPSSPPRAVLLRSVASTEAAKTAKLTMSLYTSGLPTSVNFDASGAIDFASGNASMDLQAAGTSIEERIVGGVVYIRAGSADWHSLNLKSLGLNQSSFAQSQSNPAQFLAYLAGVSDDVKRLDTATVDGVTTTHYHATIDLGRALQRSDVPAALRQKLAALAPQFATLSIPTDVWIDEQGRARRITMTIDLADMFKHTQLANRVPAGASETVQLEFYDFGAPVNVVAPPANEVTPVKNPLGG